MFLAIMAAPVFLSVKFIIEQTLIEQEVEEKMNSVVLQSITISNADITWVKAGKEILVAGKYFDVKSYEINNGVATLTGYFDNEETGLLTELKKHTENNGKDNILSKYAFKYLFPIVYNSFIQMLFDRNQFRVSNIYYSFCEMLPTSPSLAFIQPPKI